jgi:hypothetical protein
MALTADQATKMAPVALAGVVLAGAFAVIAYLAPAGDVPEIEIAPADVDRAARTVDFQADWPESDWPAISGELARLNHLKAPETDEPGDGAVEPVADAPDAEADQRDPDVVELADFTMLGAITAGDTVVALVESGDRQRFVSPGDVVGRYKIVRVETDHVIIDLDGEEKKLELAPGSGRELRADQQYISDRNRRIENQEQQRLRELRERRERLLEDRPDRNR